MYLSKIEIIGFKSFAQRVNVNFDSGVTAIVGPNGCGKTNIVDAIRWALGEQRYSTLRSDKMEDVIFNGTKNRKPLGLSEVSLTIENTKGILPTEYSEVTITRRVFRSGESEYQLNKVPCRLKDILDLFMDTGMGSDAYSVIELKMVESILSDKTDERRRLFEEAAGVTKYKHRRKAAMRKLEDVRLDLSRVNDIVKEVQKTVNSLERQAKKAEQYNEVSGRLKALEVDLQEREYAYNHNKLKPLEEKFALAQTGKSEIDAALRKQEEHIDSLRASLQEIELQLGESQRSATTQFEAIHRIEEKTLVGNERLGSLTATIARYELEKSDLRQQEEMLRQEKVGFAARRDELSVDLASTEKLYHETKDEHRRLSEQVDAIKAEVSSLNETLLTLAHEMIQKRGDQERVKTRMDNLKGRIDRSTEDNALYLSDIGRNQLDIARLTAEDRELRQKFAAKEVELVEREKTKKELKTSADKLQQRIIQLRADIERRGAKIDFLKRMIETNEGYSEGARYLLGATLWKQKKLTTVADVIHAQEKYRKAIETAIADTSSCLVVDDVDDGYAAIEELEREDKGKATFICLQWIPRILHKKRTRKAVFTWASTIVECDEKYRSLLNFLLDDVVIVETLDQAKQVLASHAGVRCITLEGRVLSSVGMLRGGSQRLDEGGLISKKEQINEIERERAALQSELQSCTEQYNDTLRQHDALEIKSYVDAVKSVEKEMTAVEMRIAQLEFEKKRANDGIERNNAEVAALQIEIAELQGHFDTASTELSSITEQKSNQEAVANATMHKLESFERQFHDTTKLMNEFEIKVVTLQGDVKNVERDAERTDARIHDIQITFARRGEEIVRAQEEIARLTTELAMLNSELDKLRAEYEALLQHKREVEQTYSAKRNELHQIELSIKDERRLHDEAVGTSHDLEMKISELKSAIEHIRLRAKEEFDIDLQLKTYPEDEFVDFAQLREEIKSLKDRIRILGAINFAAFDEFTTEGERLNFLTQQRDDLIEAETTLLNTIEEINTTAQRKFSETFSKIRENFIIIFKELFMEGDECDLKIEEGVDPLEANIEIIAKPRGKRPTSIDLLSGGEKTLTAIALLFAIYLVKPSPFCILDEVDAPLDDSNIDRYTRILKKFSNNTQFIVVTHNKRTMEAAHALYGVTMEEEGVSKVVTVRFNEEARVRSATVTN
jgi:chromosome segregation protein